MGKPLSQFNLTLFLLRAHQAFGKRGPQSKYGDNIQRQGVEVNNAAVINCARLRLGPTVDSQS
jgi:hypothetical protein